MPTFPKFIVERMVEAGDPPSELATCFSDAFWREMFVPWADALMYTLGDMAIEHTARFGAAYAGNMSTREMWEKFGPGGEWQLEPGEAQIEQFRQAAEEGVNEDAARAALWFYALEVLNPHYPAFVEAVQKDKGDALQPLSFDQAAIDQTNEINLKGLKPDENTSFFQRGPILLIGSGHPDKVVAWAAQGKKGFIEMLARGSLGSTGEMEVSGYEDEAVFKECVRRFSKKKITFK